MAQNYLYMIEFVVDDLIITDLDECIPEMYPTCVDVSFHSSVHLSICEPDFGQDLKCGKCVIFSLDRIPREQNNLLLQVFKRKSERCAWLIGATEIPIQNILDKITSKYSMLNRKHNNKPTSKLSVLSADSIRTLRHGFRHLPPDQISNFNIEAHVQKWSNEFNENNRLDEPSVGTISKASTIQSQSSDLKKSGDTPNFTSEILRKLVQIFNLKGKQTGTVACNVRLSCLGPTIMSNFPFDGKLKCTSSTNLECEINPCSENIKIKEIPSDIDPCDIPKPKPVCCAPKPKSARCTPKPKPKCCTPKPKPTCDPCNGRKRKSGGSDPCTVQRPSTCNPCNDPKPKPSCADVCDDDESIGTCESVESICKPVKTLKGKKIDTRAYDEFEADLNGSGIIVRVLKNTHHMKKISDDGCEEENYDDFCKNTINKIFLKENKKNAKDEDDCCSLLKKNLCKESFVQNHLKRRTGGTVENDCGLPNIRTNMKYPGNERCENNAEDNCEKIEKYRKKPNCNRNCCLQVKDQDIDNAMKGINRSNQNGIEVCRKGFTDTENDVFILKLGKKPECKENQPVIEIELKTPKGPNIQNRQKITLGTQVDDDILDSTRNKAKKDQGGNGKKGKGKGKGKKGKK